MRPHPTGQAPTVSAVIFRNTKEQVVFYFGNLCAPTRGGEAGYRPTSRFPAVSLGAS
ncbi:MAG TPA: hypothetical protein VIT20_10065 [Propionibacteriaceae bacterium]